jgi:hypothetical protein
MNSGIEVTECVSETIVIDVFRLGRRSGGGVARKPQQRETTVVSKSRWSMKSEGWAIVFKR